MRGFGEERNRVREVSAHGLDDREASENHQGNEKLTLADVLRVAMRAVAVAMFILMDRMDAVIRVMMMVVMLVGVWHEPGTP